MHILLRSKFLFNLGKKSGGEKEEQAAGGKHGRKSTPKKEDSAKQQAGPSESRQQKSKTHVEPALGLSADVTTGPSRQPQQPFVHVVGV